jgi:hypothetical protein
MRHAADEMRESTVREERGLAAYIDGLTERRTRESDVYVRTPAILGQFRIDVGDPNIRQVFGSRANAC